MKPEELEVGLRPGRAAVVFLGARLLLIASLPLEGLRGYGDALHFYRLAGLGTPYVDLWVEFPPLFPFLSRGVYLLAGGREPTYLYGLTVLLSLVQAASVYLFGRLLEGRSGVRSAAAPLWLYSLVLIALPYGWWYFDPLVTFFTLLALVWMYQDLPMGAGLAAAGGVLTKGFPIVLLPVFLVRWPWRRALTALAAAVLPVLLVGAALLVTAPEMTRASLASQASKGSWETVWALMDGNFGTGNFGPEEERLDPASAYRPRGRPPRLPPWLTLPLFAAVGVWAMWRAYRGALEADRLLLFLWLLVLLWSPGWSPQWVLPLLPLLLLALPWPRGALMAGVLLAVAVLEWPVLLSRGRFDLLWAAVLLRTALLILAAGMALSRPVVSQPKEASA